MNLITSSSWRQFDGNGSASCYTLKICKRLQKMSATCSWSVAVRRWLRGGRDGIFPRYTYLESTDAHSSAELTQRCRLQ
jgi:hypothetical protein